MFHGEKPVLVKLPSLEVELSEERLEEMLKKGRLKNLFEILMESEKSAAEVYTYLAENVEDFDVRDILEQLAKMEEEHYKRLKDIYKTLN